MKYYYFKVESLNFPGDMFSFPPPVTAGYVFEANKRKAHEKIQSAILKEEGGYHGHILVRELPKERAKEFVEAVDQHRSEDIERIIEEIEGERKNCSQQKTVGH